MKLSLLLLFLLTNICFGQKDRDNYLITVDKYSFRPLFVTDGKASTGQFTSVDEGDLKSYDIRFPKRYDTILMYNPEGKPTKELSAIDWYSIDLFVDSVNRTYIDTLLKSIVSLSYKKQARQIYSITFQIMYADGKRIHKTVSSNKFIDAKALFASQPPYSYIIISQIRFFGDNKQQLYIDEVIGWKIKDD